MIVLLMTALPNRTAEAAGPRRIDPDPPYHGLAIQIHRTERPVETYGRLIREVSELGADTVLLSMNGYQVDVDSMVIDIDRTCTDAQWLELFAIARGAGLRIVLMPKILLTDPKGGTWRGKIKPASWDVWFEQYERFILHCAQLAQQGRVEVLIVGSELISTEKFTDRWRKLITKVRRAYYGRVAYSANWDHYRNIRFWGDVDLLGLTTYHNLNRAEKPNPTADDLKAAWVPIRDEILEWQATINRPLLFTEVGWCSQEGCSIEPWNYYHKEEATPAGHAEQAANYRAFIETWADRSEVGGLLWWEWTKAAGGSDDFHYTPRNKPAEQVLRSLFRTRRVGDSQSPRPE